MLSVIIFFFIENVFIYFFFFFQAEDGIRDIGVTGVQTCALPIFVSDGADTASDRSLLQTIEVIRRNDAFVYAIAIDAPDGRESTRVNPDALRDITNLTGGYTEVVRSAADLGPATERIADELNKQY